MRLSQLPTAYVHPINLCNSWGSGLSDPAPLRWMRQEPWLESVINFPFFASCIVLEAFSLPARGFGHWAEQKEITKVKWGAKSGALIQWD